MRANEILEKLQEDITVPDIVQKKADMAFEEVRRQSEMENGHPGRRKQEGK